MKVLSQIKGVEVTREQFEGQVRIVQTMKCSACNATRQFCNNKGATYPQEAVFKFARQNGWEPSAKGKHICPDCKERKAVTKTDTPREMSPKERRMIFREIDDNYEESASRYVDNVTDDSISRKLDVPRKWVEEIRSENFGPSGENSEMQRVGAAVGRITADLTDAINDCLKAAEKAEKLKNECEQVRADLDRIRKAVGPQRVA